MEWQERICRIEGRVWMIAHLPLLLGRTVGYVSILCTKKTMLFGYLTYGFNQVNS